jgi:hypothetical protein
VDTRAANTFWVQSSARPTLDQRLVTIGDTFPTADRWDYVGVAVTPRRGR